MCFHAVLVVFIEVVVGCVVYCAGVFAFCGDFGRGHADAFVLGQNFFHLKCDGWAVWDKGVWLGLTSQLSICAAVFFPYLSGLNIMCRRRHEYLWIVNGEGICILRL